MATIAILSELLTPPRIAALATIFSTLFIVTVVVPKTLDYIRLAAIPVVGKDFGGEEERRKAYLKGARKLYNDGYKNFKNGIFQITTSRKSKIVVFNPRFLPELNKLPNHILSMEEAVNDSMETKYTKIETHIPIIPHTVTGKLTPSLPRLNVMISDETSDAIALEIPVTKDWSEVNIHHALLRIVAMVSGRIFIGPELCRTEKYLDAAINYTMDVMKAQRAVVSMRPWLRPFLASRLPECQSLYKRLKDADEFMKPLIEKRREAHRQGVEERPDDMLQWLIEALPKYPDPNSQDLARVQLGLSFAAIHTTTLSATNVFYNIAAMQEYIPILREEIVEALAAHNGVFTSQALQAMKKLDSFLKETMRLNPATMASFQRKVLRPFTLSDGQHIPAGVTIEIPAIAVNSDEELFPNPEKFDGLRFYNKRMAAKDAASAAHTQFVSVGTSNLSFGYGRHACPGRFFAANEIKMVLAHVLLRYDVKLADGATERYPNLEFAHMSIPDPSKNLLFKARD